MSRLVAFKAITILALSPILLQAAEEPVKKFTEVGLIVELHTLYPQIAKNIDAEKSAKTDKRRMAERALVTKNGVYAFLENTETEKALADIPSNTPVMINGLLYTPGQLIHVENIYKTEKADGVDLKKYNKVEGKQITLNGKNKCQCGLKVGTLPTSCNLGHLHHLEAKDGKTYHYIHSASGKNAFLGKDCHFKKVTVAAKLFPGNFLLVENFSVKQ